MFGSFLAGLSIGLVIGLLIQGLWESAGKDE